MTQTRRIFSLVFILFFLGNLYPFVQDDGTFGVIHGSDETINNVESVCCSTEDGNCCCGDDCTSKHESHHSKCKCSTSTVTSIGILSEFSLVPPSSENINWQETFNESADDVLNSIFHPPTLY